MGYRITLNAASVEFKLYTVAIKVNSNSGKQEYLGNGYMTKEYNDEESQEYQNVYTSDPNNLFKALGYTAQYAKVSVKGYTFDHVWLSVIAYSIRSATGCTFVWDYDKRTFVFTKGSGSSTISYLSNNYMQWLTIAEGYEPYPYWNTADNAAMQSVQNVTMGIGFTFDNTKRNWDILRSELGWTDNDISTIISGVYSGTNYKNSQYAITQAQVYEIFRRVAEREYMPNLNTSISYYNSQNGLSTTYSQQQLEAMFDFSYNNGLAPSQSTNWTYSTSMNDKDKIIYYYLREDQPGGVAAVKLHGATGNRRRINQMSLFFLVAIAFSIKVAQD